MRLIRAWLKAGVMEEGKVTHPDRGSPQGGVISPTLSNIFLHEVDRQWCRSDGVALGNVRLVRYADDMVLLGPRRAQLELVEGRFHQVKRMFAAHGCHVLTLHRSRFGPYHVEDLEPGQWRVLEFPGVNRSPAE